MTRRVLFSDSLRFWGGGENLILLLARGLAERNWEPVIAGRKGSELLRRATERGIPTETWPYRHDGDPSTILAASRFMRRFRPDAIMLTTGRDVRTVGIAARVAKVPTIWTMGVPLPNRGLAHRLSGRHLVTRIIVPSSHLQEQMSGFGFLNGKVSLIPNGIPECAPPSSERVKSARISLGWSDSSFVILFVGRLIERKGVDTLIAGFDLIAKGEPEARLVIVGSGSSESSLREQTARLELGNRIEFTGFTDEPARYYDACDLVVVPSRWEPFGLVLLEAMVRAKPVIATRVGGIPEVAGDVAELILRDDPVALSNAIRGMIDDPVRRARIGRAGRERVLAHFTSARMIERYEKTLLELITKSGESTN